MFRRDNPGKEAGDGAHAAPLPLPLDFGGWDPDDAHMIVTRHAGAVEWLCRHLCPDLGPAEWVPDLHRPGYGVIRWGTEGIDVWPEVDADDLGGDMVVAGNLPFALAARCRVVWAIEFAGKTPRGLEYTADDMEAAGARLVPYVVRRPEGGDR